MNCLAGYKPERILSVLNQFTKVNYCLPSCQMVRHNLFLVVIYIVLVIAK